VRGINMRRKIIIITVVCLILAASSTFLFYLNSNNKSKMSKDESETIVSSQLIPIVSKELLLKMSDVIILGEVIEKLPQKDTNLEGDKINPETGEVFMGCSVTDYLVKIESIYKGVPYNRNVITVRSVDVIADIIVNDMRISLEVGDKALYFLANIEESDLHTGELYYSMSGGNQGYFVKKNNSSNIYASTHLEIDLNNLENDIKMNDEYDSFHYDNLQKRREKYKQKVEAYKKSQGVSTPITEPVTEAPITEVPITEEPSITGEPVTDVPVNEEAITTFSPKGTPESPG